MMGMGNLGIALGAGADHLEKMQESAMKRDHYAAAAEKTRAETDELVAAGKARKELGEAVDGAVQNMYGTQPGTQAPVNQKPSQVASQVASGQVQTPVVPAAIGVPGVVAKPPVEKQPTAPAPEAGGVQQDPPVEQVSALPAPVAIQPSSPVASPPAVQPTGQPVQVASQPADYGAWRKTGIPKLVSSFIKAGKPAQAREAMDFFRGEEGQLYGQQWLKGMSAHEAGDYDGAVPHFTSLYNVNRPDGRRITFRSAGDGNYSVDHIDDKSGQVLATRTVSAKDLSGFGLQAMSPSAQVKWRLDRDAEAEKYQRDMAKLGTQEKMRLERDQAIEDRRDDRMNKRFEHQDNSSKGGGLTLQQQRSNEEIELARQTIGGLSPDDVKRRTAQFTTTGRENPDYDPSISTAARLANRRKIGDDPVFDKRLDRQPQGDAPAAPGKPAQVAQNPVQNRFGIDPAMKGHRLGNQTAKGFEVFDANGKLIGHYK